MLILLPLFAFFLMWVLLYRSSVHDRGVRASFLGASLIWGALVIANTEVLSVPGALTRPSLILFWIVAVSVTAILLTKSSDPDIPKPKRVKDKSLIDGMFVLMILTIVMLVGLTALIAPPNNWDSMTYHMSRVAHWLQNKTVAFYPTSMPRQVWAGPGAEYIILQLQILAQSDRFANMAQWWSMGGSLIGVSLIAKILGASRRGQILSALLAATLPVGILEASSTQNDYVTAYWLVCFVFFTLKLMTSVRREYAFFAALAVGLALLTKSVTLSYVLPFLVWMIIHTVKQHQTKIFPALGLFAIIPLVINGPQMMRNYDLSGNLFSLTSESRHVSNDTFTLQGTVSNAVRYLGLNMAVDNDTFNKDVERAVIWAHQTVHWNPADARYTAADDYQVHFSRHEDSSSNTATMLVLFAAIVLFLYPKKPIDRKNLYYLLSWFGAFVMFCLLLKWQPWGNRLLLPLAVLSTPFMAAVFDRHRPAVGITLGLLLVFVSFPWIVKNTSRAMMSKDGTIFSKNRQEQYFSNNPGMLFTYQRAAEEIQSSGCTQVGLLMTSESWEYQLWPFLGAPRNRNLRIEHINVSNPTQKYPYPLGDFDPCVVLGDGAAVDANQMTVNQTSYVKTNQWGYLSLFRKDANGEIGTMTRRSYFLNMLALSQKADQLLAQSRTSGLTADVVKETYRLRSEALRYAKQLDQDALNSILSGLGTTVGELFIQGHELFLKGFAENSPATVNEGQNLINAWNAWFEHNRQNIQRSFGAS